MTKGSFGNIETNNSNISNSNIMTPCMKKLDRMFSIKRFSMQNESSKKEGKTNILKQVIVDGHRYQKMKTFNFSGKKGREMQSVKVKEKKKSIDNIYNMIEKKEESENEDLKEMDEEIKKMREEKKKQQKDYKKLLDKNCNKTQFYIFELKKIFRKNEIYIHLALKNDKKCITEPTSERNSPKKFKTKKSFYGNNSNTVYIIICDDEEFVARSAKELIMKYYIKKGKDPHVYFTPNGIECLYLMYKLFFIQNRKIEYILMDLEMPYLNGVKTCNIIKSIKEIDVPVYILSGDEPSNCSADGYCNKPLNEIDVINKLDK
jgi:CheY-like chemotaxis protein